MTYSTRRFMISAFSIQHQRLKTRSFTRCESYGGHTKNCLKDQTYAIEEFFRKPENSLTNSRLSPTIIEFSFLSFISATKLNLLPFVSPCIQYRLPYSLSVIDFYPFLALAIFQRYLSLQVSIQIVLLQSGRDLYWITIRGFTIVIIVSEIITGHLPSGTALDLPSIDIPSEIFMSEISQSRDRNF